MEEKSTVADVVEPGTNDAAVVPVSETKEIEGNTASDTDVKADAADTEKSEPKPDPAARLREAKETITRASHDAEVFKRRRDEGDAAVPAKSEDGEAERIAEEKKREEAADEKRAALEYAESYRARVRKERESAAAKKKEEERERAKAEEKAAREREIAEGIEREREEAKARSARMESLLEKVGVDIVATPATVDETATVDATAPTEEPDTTTTALPMAEYAAPVVETAPASEPASVEETEPVSEPVVAAVEAPSEVAETPGEPVETPAAELAVAETSTEDYTITIDGGECGKDVLFIEGGLACEIALGSPKSATPEYKPTATGVSDSSTTAAKVALAYAPALPTMSRPAVEPTGDVSVPYSDFPAAEPAPAPTPSPVRDDSESYEEEVELIRHSKERNAPKKDKEEIPEYPDFEPIESKKGKGKAAKGELTEEERDMLAFARSHGGKGGKKSKEEHLIGAYEHAEAERLEIIDAEMADAKRTEKEEKPKATKKEKKPRAFFDKGAVEKNKRRQVKNDILLIEHRIYDEIRTLEMDVSEGVYSFSTTLESRKEKRERSKVAAKLKRVRRGISVAKKYEAEDNARYYYLVTTDIDGTRMPESIDKDELKKTREELLCLLARRDELNLKLIELYSISAGGKTKLAEKRYSAIIAGKKKMYAQMMPNFRKYERAEISTADKKKLYALLDERIQLAGDLARINFMLKSEKAQGEAKKELKREKSKVVRQLDENKRAIIHYEKTALNKAEVHHETKQSVTMALVGFFIVVAIVVLCVLFWDQIVGFVSGAVGAIGSKQ